MRILRLSSFAALLSIGCLLSGCFGQGRARAPSQTGMKRLRNRNNRRRPRVGPRISQPPSSGNQPMSRRLPRPPPRSCSTRLLKGITDNDYSLYSKDFTEPLKLVIPAGKFAEDVKDKKNKIGGLCVKGPS